MVVSVTQTDAKCMKPRHTYIYIHVNALLLILSTI